MGIEAHYVMVTGSELQQLLAGGTEKIIDGFRDEYSSLYGTQLFNLNDLRSAGRAVQLDMICKRYALGDSWWRAQAEAFSLSEDEIVEEAKRRGFHLWLDLEKKFADMDALLARLSLCQLGDPDPLSRALPSVEEAKCNPAFPGRWVIDIEESRNAVRGMLDWVKRQAQAKLQAECPRMGDDLMDVADFYDVDADDLYDFLGMPVYELDSILRHVATMQADNDAALIKACQADLIGLAQCAKSIQSLLTNILAKLRANELSEAKSDMLLKVPAECHRLKTVLARMDTQRSAIRYFGEQPIPDQPISSMSDKELLSIAVYARKRVPPGRWTNAAYLAIDEVRAIAKPLERLTYTEIVENQDRHVGEKLFDEFKTFYVTAAEVQSGVLLLFG
jgi:hypothetical protein